jgi:hypothetical protein
MGWSGIIFSSADEERVKDLQGNAKMTQIGETDEDFPSRVSSSLGSATLWSPYVHLSVSERKESSW